MAIAVWARAIRYQFSTSVTLISTLGTAMAWHAGVPLSPSLFVLTLLALLSIQVGLHLSDDYFDYRHGVDTLDPQRRNLYAGGSKVLPQGLLTPQSVVIAFSVLYGLTGAIGAYLAWRLGSVVLLLGVFGVLCSYFYSAPPLKLAYRGFGELCIGLNFGPIIGVGAFLVQFLDVQKGNAATSIASTLASVPGSVWLMSLPLGLITFSMIVVQEIADYDEDLAGNKRTLIIRFGKRLGIVLHTVSLAAAYVAIAVSVPWQGAPPLVYIAFLGLPAALRSVVTFVRTYDNPAKLEQAVADFITFRLHSLTGILLILAYCVEGIRSGRPAAEAAVIMSAFGLVYAPVAVILYRQSPLHGFLPRCLHLVGLRGATQRTL